MAYTWSKSTPATGREAIHSLKTLLVLVGWTVEASSTGSTGTGYNATGDNLIAATDWNTNAWVRLQDPAGITEIVIQRGAGNQSWRILRSHLAKFSGGSPGATQTPAATDEDLLWGGGTHAAPTFGSLLNADGGTWRWNCGADGAAPYAWWAGAFNNGGSIPQTILFLDSVVNGEPTDVDKYTFYAASAVSGGAPGLASSLGNETIALTQQALQARVAGFPTAGVLAAMPMLTYSTGSRVVYPSGGSTNPISLKDEVLPIVYARPAAIANPGYKGVSGEILWQSVAARSTGETLSVDSSRDRIVFRDLAFKWDGSVPTV